MYAAAGGASLASRQARLRQKQKKQQAAKSQSKELKPPQAKQYHNYTDDAISLAAAAAATPAPKLSRVERGVLRPPAQPHERRHSASNYHLKAEKGRPGLRESPSISIPVQAHHHHQQQQQHQHHHVPPGATPHENHLLSSSPSSLQQLPQILIPEGEGRLERRCSFVRQVEEMEKGSQEGGLLDRCNHLCNFEIKHDKVWDEGSNFMEYERDVFGSLDYPFSECSQGRAAWQERERGRRCSLTEEARQHRIKQTEAHHRWMKRNRIHDSTYGGGSEDDDFFSVYHQSAAANALLYVGLGTTAIGSVIFFVGTGEKGFKTLELRLIGPTLIACGLLCCLIRVLLCACPSTCLSRRRKKSRLKDSCPHSSSSGRFPLSQKLREHADFTVDSATLLQKGSSKKKVSIVPPSHSLPSTSDAAVVVVMPKDSSSSAPPTKSTASSLPGVHIPLSLSIPQIQLPDGDRLSSNSGGERRDSVIELQNLDLLAYDLESLNSCASDTSDESNTTNTGGVTVIETVKRAAPALSAASSGTVSNKLMRTREPANNASSSSSNICNVLGKTRSGSCASDDDIETCLSVVIERSDNSDQSSDSGSKSKQKGTAVAAAPHSATRAVVGTSSGTAGISSSSSTTTTTTTTTQHKQQTQQKQHSGILLSPLQLGQ